MAAGVRPARAYSHRGAWLSGSHSSPQGVTALFAGQRGGASCQAQWSLNPEVLPPRVEGAPAPPHSCSRALAGRLPSRPHSHALALAQLPGPGPPPPAPRSAEPCSGADLQLRLPTLPWLLVPLPQGLGSSSAQHRCILM